MQCLHQIIQNQPGDDAAKGKGITKDYLIKKISNEFRERLLAGKTFNEALRIASAMYIAANSGKINLEAVWSVMATVFFL